MSNWYNKTPAKSIALILTQIFLFTSVACPESLSNKDTSSLYIHGKDLRVPIGSYNRMLEILGKKIFARFSLYSRNNKLTQEGVTDKFQIGETTYAIGEFDKESINQLGEPIVIPDQSGRNITFTIRGPTEKNNLAKYLHDNPLFLQEAISRSQSLYNGGLNQNITIILADKYDYLAGDHRQNNLMILNASDLETMLQQNESVVLVSEFIAFLLLEELAYERGADGEAETKEKLAQDGAHATRYAITHKPYAPTLSEYISFLEKYTLEIKGDRGYLSYLKVMNRYQDMEWTRKFAKLVAERTVCVFHMENAFSRQILDNLYSRFLQKGYTKKAAELAVGRIAQLTMAGGLGNIKRELADSWSEKGVNLKSLSPLYGRWIKGVGNIDQSLVDVVLETMGDPQFKFKTKIFNRDNVMEEIEVEVAVYKDPFSPSNYWIYCPEIFDGAYSDNKIHLAQQLLLYRKASLEYLLYLHSKGEVKDKFLFSLSEVYTALLIPDVIEDEYSDNPVLKDIFIHHYNHTVVAAGMPKLPQFLYDVLHIKEKYRDSVVQHGEIILADLIGQGSDEITGCSVKHTEVLRRNNMAKFKDKIPDNISEANSEGAYIDNWQGEEMQKVYERYFLMLEANDDEELFKKLDENQDIRERFTKDMLLAKERHKQVFKEWQTSYGVNLKDGLKLASLTRRMVPYKRLDVVTAMLSIRKYLNQLKDFMIGFSVGGRHFDIDQSDFGITQINVINKISEKEPGYIATVPDNTDYPGYNIFNAHNIYEGVDATIMLSDEDLEAGPTSPSKGLVNGDIIIATPDGVMPELLIDFNEDPVNGNGFRVEYCDPEIQNMVRGFLNKADSVSKEEILEKGRNGSTSFVFHTSRSENNGIIHADSIGLKGFFDTQNRLLFDRVTIFNQHVPEEYIDYMLCLFKGIEGAEEIIAWLTRLRDSKELEAYEKYSDVRSFLIEILGARREPTVKALFKALKGFNDAWNDPEKKNRLFYNAFKTGMLKANSSIRQGPGLIELWESGLREKLSQEFYKDVQRNLDALRKRWESEPEAFAVERTQSGVERILKRMQSDPDCFIGFGDMSKIGVMNYVFTRKVVDKLIPVMIGAADFVLSKYNGFAVRIGGDEAGIILPSDLSWEDVNRIRSEVQQTLAYFIDGKYSFAQIKDMLDEHMNSLNDVLKLETKDPLVKIYKDKDGFFIIYDKSNLAGSMAGLIEPGASIFSMPSPSLSFGIVKAENRNQDVHANYGQSIDYAEYVLNISKENGLNGATSQSLAGLDKFKEAKPAMPGLSKEERVRIAEKYTRLGIQLFADDIEEYYPAVKREKLYYVLEKMSSAGIGTTILIRGPPDNFYVITRVDGKRIRFMKLEFVYEPYDNLKENVSQAIGRGRFAHGDLREHHGGGYGFKVINEFYSHSTANRVILGINNSLNQMFETPQALNEALADDIGKTINSRLREENVQVAAKVILNAMPLYINGEEGVLEKAIENIDYLAKFDIPLVPEKMQETVTAEGNIFKRLYENNEKFESLVRAQRKRERKYFYDILNQAYEKVLETYPAPRPGPETKTVDKTENMEEERQQDPKALSLEKLFVANKNVSPAVTRLDSLSMTWQLFMKLYLIALGLEEEEELDRIDFNGKSLMFVGAETPEIPLRIARQFPLSRIIVVNPKWETKRGGNVIVIGDEVQQLAKYKDEIGMVDFIFSSGLFNEEWLRFVVDAQHDSKSVYERMLNPLVEILSPDGIMIISEGPKISSRKSRLEEVIQAVDLKIVNEEVDIGTEGGIYIIRKMNLMNLRNEILERNDSMQAVQSGL